MTIDVATVKKTETQGTAKSSRELRGNSSQIFGKVIEKTYSRIMR